MDERMVDRYRPDFNLVYFSGEALQKRQWTWVWRYHIWSSKLVLAVGWVLHQVVRICLKKNQYNNNDSSSSKYRGRASCVPNRHTL